MRIKLDEYMSNAHTQLLKQVGHECDRVTDKGLSGATDGTVWQQVCQEQRFFIALDLDFSDVRRFPPGIHPGILLLRPRSRSRHAVLDLLSWIVNGYPWNPCKVVWLLL